MDWYAAADGYFIMDRIALFFPPGRFGWFLCSGRNLGDTFGFGQLSEGRVGDEDFHFLDGCFVEDLESLFCVAAPFHEAGIEALEV